MSQFRLFVKNSAANVVSGAANAVLSVALPPVLVRHLSSDAFSTWTIVLQLAAIVGIFGFGVQVAIGRYVAHCTASGDHAFRRQIVSTALAGMWGAAILALSAVGIMAWLLPAWFPGMPPEGRDEARLALLLVGSSLAAGLPATVPAGVFSGVQRNEVPAFINVGSRIAIAVALIALAVGKAGLAAMGGAYFVINLIAATMQFVLLRRRYADFGFRRSDVTARAGRELAGYCLSLTIWSVAMIVIGGLDAVIAGRLDFRWAAYFGIAGSVVTLIMGAQTAAFQPLVAIAAQLHSRGESARLGALLIEVTRVNASLLLFSVLPFYAAGSPLLAWWVGRAFGAEVMPILQVTLIGIFLRQTLAPFATILLGTGEQRLVIATPVYEGLAKLAVSIGLGIWIGAIGIALGTVVGSFVCLATNLLLNFPRVKGFVCSRRRFGTSGVLLPTVAFFPMLLVAGADAMLVEGVPLIPRILATLLACAGAFAVGWPSIRRLRALL